MVTSRKSFSLSPFSRYALAASLSAACSMNDSITCQLLRALRRISSSPQ